MNAKRSYAKQNKIAIFAFSMSTASSLIVWFVHSYAQAEDRGVFYAGFLAIAFVMSLATADLSTHGRDQSFFVGAYLKPSYWLMKRRAARQEERRRQSRALSAKDQLVPALESNFIMYAEQLAEAYGHDALASTIAAHDAMAKLAPRTRKRVAL